MDYPIDAEAGEANMFSKDPKRIIYWISKAWTPYDKLSLPVSYEEAIARLLTLKHIRNLIETQEIKHEITCYSDYLPGINNASLSNEEKLLINIDNPYLTVIVKALYKSRPTMVIVDSLAGLARQEIS